ncbi:nucleoid occlusion protein [Lacticaseibacillus sharpeae]|uniref:Nucleoid occlusion protein n=1 Tax=Lacticaseibacillus sharpeae JCM 1186 = DSM 20505 TaxID=1291052 RepID=A0A0R1ZV28_9LACO|nr:nucleoid occlusion protein [Lacticaseibacillus sharpeae]KRM55638.1 nucleoid occlusion protein [Lacticaseibacillus sharpeae JCM 1186 = DSM 20505]
MALNLFGRKKKDEKVVTELPVSAIVPNRFQPRKVFQEDAIKELAATISDHGLLQPIVVREYEHGHYEIIAGERRFRAVTTQLNWEKIPAIVTTMADDESAAMAIIENLQRAQLSPVEEARAYNDLMTQNAMTQANLARRIGKSQSFVANKLRLLKLSAPVQTAIMNGVISERHGRELLRLDPEQQTAMLERIALEGLTVKDTARIVQEIVDPEAAAAEQATPAPAPEATPEPEAKAAPAKPKPRKRRALNHDSRIALNTIKKSLKLVKDSGMKVKEREEDDGDVYRVIIEIPKK